MRKIILSLLILLALSACSPNNSRPDRPEGALQTVVASRPPAASNEPQPIVIDQNISITVTDGEPAVVEVSEGTTEEALYVALSTSVDEANQATEAYATATTEALEDGEVSAEEVATIEIYVAEAEQAAAQAAVYLESYEAVYADAALAELDQISAELSAINASLTTMNTTLESIDDSLATGVALAEESLAQLEAAAAQAEATAASVQQGVADRADEIQALVDANLAGEYADQAQEYLDSVQAAAADGTFDEGEIETLVTAGEQASQQLSEQGYAEAAAAVDNAVGQLEENGGATLIETIQNRPNRP